MAQPHAQPLPTTARMGREEPLALALAAFTAPEAAVRAWIDALLRHLRRERFVGALDLRCGAGQRLPALAASCGRALGLVQEPRLLFTARRQEAADIQVRDLPYVQITAHAAFDLVLAWDGCLAYLHEPAHRLAALRTWLRALRPGGVLALELPLLPRAAQAPTQPIRAQRHLVDGTLVTREIEHTSAPGGLIDRLERLQILTPDGRRQSLELLHRMAPLDREELHRLLRQTGFLRVEEAPPCGDRAVEGLDGEPTLSAIARR